MIAASRRLVTRLVAMAAALVDSPPAVAMAADSIDRTNQVRAAIEGGQAKNVILLIGDGLGDSEITIARNYAAGAGGRLAIDQLPLTRPMTTYSVLKWQGPLRHGHPGRRAERRADGAPDRDRAGRHGRDRARGSARRGARRDAARADVPTMAEPFGPFAQDGRTSNGGPAVQYDGHLLRNGAAILA